MSTSSNAASRVQLRYVVVTECTGAVCTEVPCLQNCYSTSSQRGASGVEARHNNTRLNRACIGLYSSEQQWVVVPRGRGPPDLARSGMSLGILFVVIQ